MLPDDKDIIVEKNRSADECPRILVADDSTLMLKVARDILEGSFRVTCVNSGTAVFKTLPLQKPDLILLDLHMPDLDGFEVITRLHAIEEYRSIPVIFLTADNDSNTEVKGFRLGAHDFITKPFVTEIMLQRVNRTLELSRLQNNLMQEVEKQTQRSNARRKQLERLTVQVMQTLAKTIDAKDEYTKGHSLRVAEYSREIAARAGMSEKDQETIYYMGLLHDIGKIGIPDEIIHKAAKLNDDEYGIIKNHPSIGAEILRNMTELPGIGTGARWHHERYDGTGYPDGKKGEGIPEFARIICVADAYDAMTSKRSYRDILEQQAVRREIANGRGTQFDPGYADIMLAIIDEDKDYMLREL